MTTQIEPTPRDFAGVELDGRFRIGPRMPGGDPQIELYTGVQLSLERKVLIKLLRADLGSSADLEQRFRREALLLSRLDHPNIAHVIDFGMFEGCPYIVRELVEGRSLAQLLAGGKLFSPEDTVSYLVQLCDALEHAHQNGVIHRDLSPSKIILSTDGRLRITDFGVARLLKRGQESASDATSIGETLAAPEYAAPEVLLGHEIDRRSDLYSLGVIAYRMLAQKLPFTGTNAAELLTARARQPYVPLAQAAGLGKSSSRLCSVIDRLLATDREQRCSSASWVAHALKVALKEVPVLEGDEGATLMSDPPSQMQAAIDALPQLIPDLVAEPISEELPDVSSQAVLVADPNHTIPGHLPERKERPHAQLAMKIERREESEAMDTKDAFEDRPSQWAKNALGRIWDALGDSEPTVGLDDARTAAKKTDEHTAAVPDDAIEDLRDDPGSDSEIDPDAAKADWQIFYEKVKAKVAPKAERFVETMEIRKRASAVGLKASELRRKAGIPRLSKTQNLAIAGAATLLLIAVVQVASGPSAEPPPAEPTVNELATNARSLAKSGQATQAIDMIETSLVQGEKYGEPVLHAALANAYVQSGQGPRAVQHYTIAVHKNAGVLDDTDVAALAGLLALPKGDGEKVGELLRAVGVRAIAPLEAVAADKKLDKATKARAKEILRALQQNTASKRS